MTKLHLEKASVAVLLTVPPIGDDFMLERALGSYRVSNGLNWPTLSKTEPTVLELPLLRWKEVLYALLLEYDECRIMARHHKIGTESMKLVFVMDEKEWPNVSTLPKENFVFDVGSFELGKPWLRVSDPCYDKDTRCAFRLMARSGTWKCVADLDDGGAYGYRVARLTVAHLDVADNLDYRSFELVDKDVGVDSGMCGFFDDAKFPKTRNRENPTLDTFYRGICSLLVSRGANSTAPVVTVPESCGVACRTFDGDGSYVCRTLKDDAGKVAAAYLWFAPYRDPYFPDEGDYDDEYEESERE
jgi:hypothetical protein